MSKRRLASIPWLEAVFLCSPLLVAAWLSGSPRIFWLSAAVGPASLAFWYLVRRGGRDAAEFFGCFLLVAVLGAMTLVPFLLLICCDVVRHQGRQAVVAALALAAGYVSCRLLIAGRKSIALRALGLLLLAVALFWGPRSILALKWDTGPVQEDIYGWRFKWEGPER